MKEIEHEIESYEDGSITVTISDWNMERWYFTVDVATDTIDEIEELISDVNVPNRDIRYTLVNPNGTANGLYEFLNANNDYNSLVMDYDIWAKWEQYGDEHFQYFAICCKGEDIDEIKNFNYQVYKNKYEYVEERFPELYEALHNSDGGCCFDYEEFVNNDPDTFVDTDGTVIVYTLE